MTSSPGRRPGVPAPPGPAEVTLHTGAVVARAAVATTTTNLDILREKNMFAAWDAVMLARDPDAPIATATALLDRGLVDERGVMHDVTRLIILAVAPGDGEDWDGMPVDPVTGEHR